MSSIFSKEFFAKHKVSILLSLILFAFFVIENINNRFWLNDFKVYYMAASQLLHGGNLYNELFTLGSGYYKYSPFAAMFFIPLSLLPYSLASGIYFFIIVALIIYVLNVSLTLITTYFGEDNSPQMLLFFGFLAGVVHLQRELHLGNVNILLLAMLLFSIKGIIENKTILPAIVIGIVILFKPHFLILFPLLFINRKFKIILITVATILIGLLLPALLLGFGKNIELHAQWLDTMRAHNAGIINSEQTIYFLLNHYLIRFITDDIHIVFFVASIVLFRIFSLLLIKQKENNPELIQRNFLTNFFLLLALIPSITHTDTEHFIFSLPLIIYLIYYIRNKTLNPFFLIVFGLGILCYAGNIHDLVGGDLSNWMLINGILGIGNLFLIGLFIYSQLKE